MTPPVLILPGWMNSGPEHWQTRWEHAHPEWRRVEQADWDRPAPGDWLAALDAAVVDAHDRAGVPPLLVGHSLGALLIVTWAATQPSARAVGALLVAPADVERPDTPHELTPFAPMLRERLPFPSILAASRNDPYLSWERAEELAALWGAALHDCGWAGHVNTASGHGPWPEGERLLAALLEWAA